MRLPMIMSQNGFLQEEISLI